MAKLLKKQWVLILLCAAGLALIIISQLFSSDKKTEVCSDNSESEYAEKLESKLEALILSLPGVSSAEVLITADSGSESVYAEDKSSSGDSSSSSPAVLEKGSGEEAALTMKELLPSVRGVACVARGSVSRTEITELICASLGVASNRVYVIIAG